ncbi:MAG: DUF1385 domain-containing protein [Defluviitaleaceae bacterium]|nr:DUF1385 domain-containing protein [Defluviitaleaceae bacterium]
MSDSKAYSAIGGQAVIEGVMMRSKTSYAMAVRSPGNSIVIVKSALATTAKRSKILALPIIRGVVALIDSMALGMKLMTKSADIAMEETAQEPPSKFEKWLEGKLGDKTTDVMIFISVAIALVMGTGLFMLMPAFIASFTNPIIGEHTWALGIFEGLLRIAILVGYILLISRMKDIRRVFQYHGAEHKCINCLESSRELTVENVMQCSRLHKRCGTSFLLFVMIISMVTFFFVRTDVVLLRFGMRILLVPFIAGLSYEVIRWAGRSESRFVKLVSVPGLWLQRLTTQEPDPEQLEVAIAALSEVLDDKQPLTA